MRSELLEQRWMGAGMRAFRERLSCYGEDG